MAANKEVYLMGKGGIMNDCSFPLPNKAICIGTDAKSCAIIYPAGTQGIALVHCQILPQNGNYIVVDFSETGTWLNEVKLNSGQSYPLKNGDTIYVANTQNAFVFCESFAEQEDSQAEVTEQLPENPFSSNEYQKEVKKESAFNDAEVTLDDTKGTSITPQKNDGIKNKFFSWKGRLNRKPYFWRGFIIGAIQGIIIGINTIPAKSFHLTDTQEIMVGLFLVLIYVISVISHFMLVIRRCHDLNKSGWYSLFFVLYYVSLLKPDLALIVVVSWPVALYLLFKKGTNEPNRYGLDPLAQS